MPCRFAKYEKNRKTCFLTLFDRSRVCVARSNHYCQVFMSSAFCSLFASYRRAACYRARKEKLSAILWRREREKISPNGVSYCSEVLFEIYPKKLKVSTYNIWNWALRVFLKAAFASLPLHINPAHDHISASQKTRHKRHHGSMLFPKE